jgi:hypothetical protein
MIVRSCSIHSCNPQNAFSSACYGCVLMGIATNRFGESLPYVLPTTITSSPTRKTWQQCQSWTPTEYSQQTGSCYHITLRQTPPTTTQDTPKTTHQHLHRSIESLGHTITDKNKAMQATTMQFALSRLWEVFIDYMQEWRRRVGKADELLCAEME